MTSYKNSFEIPIYIKKIIKKYPKLTSGRKNYECHERRILDTINLIKKYKKKST